MSAKYTRLGQLKGKFGVPAITALKDLAYPKMNGHMIDIRGLSHVFMTGVTMRRLNTPKSLDE